MSACFYSLFPKNSLPHVSHRWIIVDQLQLFKICRANSWLSNKTNPPFICTLRVVFKNNYHIAHFTCHCQRGEKQMSGLFLGALWEIAAFFIKIVKKGCKKLPSKLLFEQQIILPPSVSPTLPFWELTTEKMQAVAFSFFFWLILKGIFTYFMPFLGSCEDFCKWHVCLCTLRVVIKIITMSRISHERFLCFEWHRHPGGHH